MEMQFPGTFTGCWLLKFPFLSGSTRKSVLSLANVSLVCWFLPVQVGLLCLLLFTELFRCAVNLNLQQNSHYFVLTAHGDQSWIYPKALQRWPETTWVGFCPVWRSSWGLEELIYLFHIIPSVLAGMSSPAHWGILGRCEADGWFNAALITWNAFISKNTVPP